VLDFTARAIVAFLLSLAAAFVGDFTASQASAIAMLAIAAIIMVERP